MSGIQWAIDGFCTELNTDEKSVVPSRNIHKKEAKRLKLCPSCDNVWEIICSGACRRYNHLPTYGLKRVICTFCEGKGSPYKER